MQPLVVEEHELFEVGLDFDLSGLLRNLLSHRPPKPLDGVCVGVRVVRVHKILTVVDSHVGVIETHHSDAVVAAPTIRDDQGTPTDILEDDPVELVDVPMLRDGQKRFPRFSAHSPHDPPPLACRDPTNVELPRVQVAFVYLHRHARTANKHVIVSVIFHNELADNFEKPNHCLG